MDLKEVMAVNLRRLRYAKGLTQEELAAKSGLSSRYIGKIERAEVAASVTVLGRIAEGLDVEASDLVRRTSPKESAPSEVGFSE
jgi:transcriptional regulator with XRE-family HTH domain